MEQEGSSSTGSNTKGNTDTSSSDEKIDLDKLLEELDAVDLDSPEFRALVESFQYNPDWKRRGRGQNRGAPFPNRSRGRGNYGGHRGRGYRGRGTGHNGSSTSHTQKF